MSRWIQHREVDDARWHRVDWAVAGRAVAAHVTFLAGAWAGWTLDLDGAAVIIRAHGLEPAGLALRDVGVGADYGLRLDEPLVYPDTVQESQARIRLIRREDRAWPLPTELQRLIDERF